MIDLKPLSELFDEYEAELEASEKADQVAEKMFNSDGEKIMKRDVNEVMWYCDKCGKPVTLMDEAKRTHIVNYETGEKYHTDCNDLSYKF